MKTKLATSDKIIEVASITFLVINLIAVAITVPNLPDTVAVHFNLNGEPDRYGSKHFLWVEVAVSFLIYMLLGVIAMFPQSMNYPSQKQDKQKQYTLGVKLMKSLRAGILFFLLMISFVMIDSAKTGSAKNMWWLLGFVPVLLIGNLIWFFIQWRKIK